MTLIHAALALIHNLHTVIYESHTPIHDLPASSHDLPALIHDPHAPIPDLHAPLPDLHHSAEPAIHAMATPIRLRVSLFQFLADADRAAVVLERDGDRVALATGGETDGSAALELRKLVAEVREFEANNSGSRVDRPSSVKPEVRRLLSRVIAAARWAGKDDPLLAARVERLSTECSVREAPLAALPLALETWAELVTTHEAQLEKPLGTGMADRLRAKAQEIRERMQTQKRAKAGAAESMAQRNAAIQRIQRIVASVSHATKMMRLEA